MAISYPEEPIARSHILRIQSLESQLARLSKDLERTMQRLTHVENMTGEKAMLPPESTYSNTKMAG